MTRMKRYDRDYVYFTGSGITLERTIWKKDKDDGKLYVKWGDELPEVERVKYVAYARYFTVEKY